MQGKGAIRFFAIALAIACVYSLSFTFVSSGVEKDAKEFANGDPLKDNTHLFIDNVKLIHFYDQLFIFDLLMNIVINLIFCFSFLINYF
jgi:hypothetical protein